MICIQLQMTRIPIDTIPVWIYKSQHVGIYFIFKNRAFRFLDFIQRQNVCIVLLGALNAPYFTVIRAYDSQTLLTARTSRLIMQAFRVLRETIAFILSIVSHKLAPTSITLKCAGSECKCRISIFDNFHCFYPLSIPKAFHLFCRDEFCSAGISSTFFTSSFAPQLRQM